MGNWSKCGKWQARRCSLKAALDRMLLTVHGRITEVGARLSLQFRYAIVCYAVELPWLNAPLLHNIGAQVQHGFTNSGRCRLSQQNLYCFRTDRNTLYVTTTTGSNRNEMAQKFNTAYVSLEPTR